MPISNRMDASKFLLLSSIALVTSIEARAVISKCERDFSALATRASLGPAEEVSIQELKDWNLEKVRSYQGRLLHFSSKGTYTEFQTVSTIEKLPRKDVELAHKILEMAHKPRFVGKASEHAGGTERGLFRLMIESEVDFLRQLHSFEHPGTPVPDFLGQAEANVLARYDWGFNWKEVIHDPTLTAKRVLKIRSEARFKPKPIRLRNPGSEKIRQGVEVGALRLRLRSGEVRSFIHTASEFDSVTGTFELVDRVLTRINPAEIVEVGFFHNHPLSTFSPLSAADAKAGLSLKEKIEMRAGHPVGLQVHAAQKIEGELVLFSSQVIP